MHLHLPVAVLLPPESCFSLSQPLLQCFKSLRMHAAPFCVVLHKSENITRLIMSKSIHKRLYFISYSNVVTGANLSFSFCASSNAALRDFSSWSASSSLIFRTASWPSLAESASVRSSTCDRNSRNIRSVWDCSEVHLSARRRVWFNSTWKDNHLINTEEEVQECWPSFVPSCLITYHLVSLLLSGWLKPSPGWGRPPHCAAVDSPDAD